MNRNDVLRRNLWDVNSSTDSIILAMTDECIMELFNSTKHVGIYIHIPFCQSKCGYCDFYSLPYQKNHPVFDQFTNALLKEIQLRSANFPGGRKLITIFLGGGTPSLLSGHHLKKMVDMIHNHFDLHEVREFTIEVNPGSATEENFRLYQEIGINRISIGAQAFQQHVLMKLERIHSVSDIYETFETARNTGFENINLDLMFGIPEQSLQEWSSSLEQAISLHPEHLSIYNLTYEHGTPFYHRITTGKLKPVPEELEEKLYNTTTDILANSGYERYEISNYCKSGFQCEHNLGYWNYRPYVGFGPSAHSFDGNVRVWNYRDLNNYLINLNSGKLPNYESEKIDKQVQLEEWLFLQMRQVKGLDLVHLKKQFKIPDLDWQEAIRKIFGQKWQDFFRMEHQSLSFTRKGFWLSDELLPKLMMLFSG